MLLFSYGSNGSVQLRERLGREPRMFAAYVRNWRRVYRGWSITWRGAPASLIKKPGAITYGNVAEVSRRKLLELDRFEGVRSGNYKQTNIAVEVEGGLQNAVAYVSTSKVRGEPSGKYLEAIAKNVGEFWKDGSRKLRPLDFYNEE